MNSVSLIGRLTKDPELKQTSSGIAFVNFSIAVQRQYKNSDGEYEADFINCIAWRTTAEFINKYFSKGSMIGVTGNIQTRSWDGDDGKKRYATDVVVNTTTFCGEKKNNSSNKVSSDNDLNGFDTTGFTGLDGSEDDLPF